MDRFNKVILSILTLIAFMAMMQSAYSSSQSSLNVSAKSAIAIEALTGKILYEKNKNLRLPMASTTKIMTAILAIENCDLEKEIEIPDEAVGVPGSSIYLEKGEKLKIIELLYGLMLASGNDAAVALAIATSGSVKDFVNLMNGKAKRLGLKNTRFSSVHGLEQGEHFTTAEDLAKLSAYAMNNPVFRKIVATTEKEIRWTTRQYNRKLKNKNKMLKNYQGADGVKTGYTRKAGRCLVTSVFKNNFRVICVVLNAPDMWNDTQKILDYAYNNYQIITVKKGEMGFVEVKDSKKKWLKIGINKDCNIIVKKDVSARFQIDLYEGLSAPIKRFSKVGQIRLICDNNTFAYPLYLLEDCKQKSILDELKERFGFGRE